MRPSNEGRLSTLKVLSNAPVASASTTPPPRSVARLLHNGCVRVSNNPAPREP
jgi:hypothetical protein